LNSSPSRDVFVDELINLETMSVYWSEESTTGHVIQVGRPIHQPLDYCNTLFMF